MMGRLARLLVLLGGLSAGVSFAQLQRCEAPETPGDYRDISCPLKATGQPQRFRFVARFSGGHDDTQAWLTASLDGAPLACEPGSKPRLIGEDGDVSIDCKIALNGKAGAEHLLAIELKWSHAQYTGVQLDAE